MTSDFQIQKFRGSNWDPFFLSCVSYLCVDCVCGIGYYYSRFTYRYTEDTMTRRNFSLSDRHDKILTTLSGKLDISMVETIQRALELLEEKDAARTREVSKS